MKNQELQEAAEKARREINEQLEAFIVKMEKLRDDGVDPMTLTEIEQEWHRLK